MFIILIDLIIHRKGINIVIINISNLCLLSQMTILFFLETNK